MLAMLILSLIVGLTPVMVGHVRPATAENTEMQPADRIARSIHHGMTAAETVLVMTDATAKAISADGDAFDMMICKMQCIGTAALSRPDVSLGQAHQILVRVRPIEAALPHSQRGQPPRRPPKATA